MANPLIITSGQASINNRTGRDSRTAARRRQDDKAIQTALAIVREVMPGMLQPTPDAVQFNELWPEVDKRLKKQLSSTTSYRRAYSWLSKQLEAGNRAKIWSVDAPAPFISIRQQRATRTLRRHQAARLVAMSEARWTAELSGAYSASSQGLLAKTLVSAIMYGGLNQPELWPRLAEVLNQPRPLRGNSSVCWIPLQMAPARNWASNQFHHNDDQNQKTAICEINFFPDPTTLGLLRQYLNVKAKNQSTDSSFTSSECLSLINEELSSSFGQNQLAWGGVTVAESQPFVELPQVLAEYAAGRTPSSSLPGCYWNRLLKPGILDCPEETFASFTAFRFKALERKTQTRKQLHPHIHFSLTSAFRHDPAKPKPKSHLIQELKALAAECDQSSELVLVNWLVSQLEDRDNAVSTAKRYMHSIAAEWLIASAPHDLTSFDQEDFQELYIHILDKPRSPKEREYRAGRLEDLHQFGVQQMDFPPLLEPLQEGTSSAAHVSAAIVDEPLFSRLLLQCDRFVDIAPLRQAMLKCFLIMAFRTGLRPGEIAKLRLRDIEPSSTAWLFVRNNKHGRNKTDAALRKVPLFPLLTEQERLLMGDFIGGRRINAQSKAELLFHQPDNPRELLDTKGVSIAVKKILADLTGGLYYKLYHLRHSALSRLQLLIHHDLIELPAEVDALIPYSASDRKRILELICGRNRLRDRYQAIAVFAGHSSPDISLSVYMHFSDLLLGLHLEKNERSLASDQAMTLLGMRPHRLRRMRKNGLPVTPAKLAGYLRHRLTRFIQPPTSLQSGDEPARSNDPRMFTHQTPYAKALAVLGKLQAGQDVRETAWFYRLSAGEIENWENCALALRNLETDRKSSRLFPKSRRHQLLPPEPVDVTEKRDLTSAHENCRKLFTQEDSRTELFWAIRHTLTHINSSHSGVSFQNAEDLQRYMSTISQIIDWPRWHLHVKVTNLEALASWQCGSLLMEHTMMNQQASFEHGRGLLKLRHPDEKMRTEKGKAGYSSHTLVTLFHRLAIIFFTPQEIEGWQHGAISQ